MKVFFKKQLLALACATQKDGYNALLNARKETQLVIDLSYPSIPAIDINQQHPDLQTISLDKNSKSILPDEWKHVCPITLWRWKLSLQVCVVVDATVCVYTYKSTLAVSVQLPYIAVLHVDVTSVHSSEMLL